MKLGVILLCLSLPSVAQMMSKAEYRDFLLKAHATIEDTDRLVTSINPEKLKVTYAMGKEIDNEKKRLSEMLNYARTWEVDAHAADSLRNDILLEESLSDVSTMLQELAWLLGDDFSQLSNSLASQHAAVLNVCTPFRHHILAFAEVLESKASK